jgi:prepilin-type processing-associated H-X9-DG protein
MFLAMGRTGPSSDILDGSLLTEGAPNGRGIGADGFASGHPGGCQFLLGDGSVRLLKETVTSPVFRALATRAGGEIIGGDEIKPSMAPDAHASATTAGDRPSGAGSHSTAARSEGCGEVADWMSNLLTVWMTEMSVVTGPRVTVVQQRRTFVSMKGDSTVFAPQATS